MEGEKCPRGIWKWPSLAPILGLMDEKTDKR